MSRFIVSTDSAVTSASVRNGLTSRLEAKGWSVWHWFQDLWLIDAPENNINLGELRDELRRTVPGLARIMIMSTEGKKDHAGVVPSESIPWIKEHWYTRKK
jgi:hypothetical protein